MFNNSQFEIALISRNKTKQDVANLLGISLVTLYRKMNGVSDFFREEIQAICLFLNLNIEEREIIFFDNNMVLPSSWWLDPKEPLFYCFVNTLERYSKIFDICSVIVSHNVKIRLRCFNLSPG